MSYENSKCACGGQKLRETFLCDDCEKAVVGTFDRTRMDDPKAGFAERRSSAIRVLATARKRRCDALPLAYSVG